MTRRPRSAAGPNTGVRSPVCPRCLDVEPGTPAGDPDRPHPGPFADRLCDPCDAANKAALAAERGHSGPLAAAPPPGTVAAKRAHVRAASSQPSRGHTCHATGCETTCKPAYFMCPPHWRLVPPDLKAAIWAHYSIGQENGEADVSRAYLAAADAAIRAVWRAEHGPCAVHAPGKYGVCRLCGEPCAIDPGAWRDLVDWPEEAALCRDRAELWQWRLHAGAWLVLRPKRPRSRAIFVLTADEPRCDATERRPGRDGLNDIPKTRARVFFGGDASAVEETEIPNALALRYVSEKESASVLVVPDEWIAEAARGQERSDAMARLLAARAAPPRAEAPPDPRQLKLAL